MDAAFWIARSILVGGHVGVPDIDNIKENVMKNSAEYDRRYRQQQAERIKAERAELAQLREEKKRWEEERKLIYSILQPGVNDLIDKYNDLLQHVFISEDDELNNEMIESYRVNFIKLPDVEITNEAVTNVEDTHEDDEKEASQEPLEEKEGKNEPDENTQSDDEAPDDPIENAAPDDEESDEVTEDEDENEDESSFLEMNDDIIDREVELMRYENEISERMGRGGKYDMPHRYSPERSHPRLFVSIADLDTQEKVKRSLQMGKLAEVPEEFQKILFQSDPVLRQEWEDYQQIVFGGKIQLNKRTLDGGIRLPPSASDHASSTNNVTRLAT